MAATTPQTSWTPTQTRIQFQQIVWLRWRIFVNQFRRKGGVGELIGKIVMYLIFGGFAIGMMAFAGSMAFFAVHTNHLRNLDLILWAAFLLAQFLNIQVGQPGTVFDPTQLIRFPMQANTYVAVRLFFGILSPGNVIIALLSFSIAVGITIADATLWLYALAALTVFTLTNALFSRMIFAWVDRWLSTRRAREVLTGCIFAFTLGIQYVNVKFNPAYNHQKSTVPSQQLSTMLARYHHAQVYTGLLPPGLLTRSLVAAHNAQPTPFLFDNLACLAFAALFLAIFAWRTRIEFRGENLTDVANAVPSTRSPQTLSPQTLPPQTLPPQTLSPQTQPPQTLSSRPERSAVERPAVPTPTSLLPPTISAVIGKELLQMRRNTGLFFGLIAPIFFVCLFAGKLASRSNATWIFPVALVYVMMGIAPLSYNSFGLEAAGTQFYFLAPIRFRDVFLAKNLINFALATLDIAVVVAIIGYVAILPAWPTLAASLLWAAGTLLFTTVLGNRRSITTPKKIDLGRTASKQASQTSALIAFGILLASGAIGGGFLLLATYLNRQWILPPIFLAFAAAAFIVYRNSLRTIDAFTLTHRESLFEELCKK